MSFAATHDFRYGERHCLQYRQCRYHTHSCKQTFGAKIPGRQHQYAAHMSASLIGRLGSSAFGCPRLGVSMSLAGSCFSPESAHRPFHHGIRRRGGTIFWATFPIAVGRSKRTCELTSSIVPRGTPFHHLVELELLLMGSGTMS